MDNICIIDSSDSTIYYYKIQKELCNEDIENWIVNSTDHKLSEISWGLFNKIIDAR